MTDIAEGARRDRRYLDAVGARARVSRATRAVVGRAWPAPLLTGGAGQRAVEPVLPAAARRQNAITDGPLLRACARGPGEAGGITERRVRCRTAPAATTTVRAATVRTVPDPMVTGPAVASPRAARPTARPPVRWVPRTPTPRAIRPASPVRGHGPAVVERCGCDAWQFLCAEESGFRFTAPLLCHCAGRCGRWRMSFQGRGA